MNRPNVNLGDKVRDRVTAYTGIAIAITDWLNGCRPGPRTQGRQAG